LSSVCSILLPASTNRTKSIVTDCTGATCGGLRWLQDIKANKITRTPGALPISELKVTYEPKMVYTTCEFKVPSALLDEIDFPVDFWSRGNQYIFLPSADKENRAFGITRRENGHCERPRMSIHHRKQSFSNAQYKSSAGATMFVRKSAVCQTFERLYLLLLATVLYLRGSFKCWTYWTVTWFVLRTPTYVSVSAINLPKPS